MAEAARERNGRTVRRRHVLVGLAVLFYGLAAFAVGTQVGDRDAAAGLPAMRTAEVRTDTLLSALTRPTAQAEAFDPDPLEAFMEVYEHLKSKYVEPIDDSERQELAYGAVRGMLRELGDPYTRFMAPEEFSDFQEDTAGQFPGIGAMLGINRQTHKIEVVRVFSKNPAAEAGLRAGDFIIAIDGEDTADMSLDVAVSKIRGEAGSTVTLTIERPREDAAPVDEELLRKYGIDPEEERTDPAPIIGETEDVVVTRRDVHIPVVEHQMMGDQIGYIWLQLFNEESVPQLTQAIADLQRQGAKGLLLDLRQNPGGVLDVCIKVASMFVPEGAVVHVQERTSAGETLSVLPQYHLDNPLPMVVLVNEFSASASEIVAGALQDHELAPVVGMTTYGKGLVQTVVPLSDNSAVAITTAKYLTPRKRDINKKGIEPDFKVETNEAETIALNTGEWDWTKLDQYPQLKRAVEALHERMP